jgi:hypothetical protein
LCRSYTLLHTKHKLLAHPAAIGANGGNIRPKKFDLFFEFFYSRRRSGRIGRYVDIEM